MVEGGVQGNREPGSREWRCDKGLQGRAFINTVRGSEGTSTPKYGFQEGMKVMLEDKAENRRAMVL